jgi:hypothetical protein
LPAVSLLVAVAAIGAHRDARAQAAQTPPAVPAPAPAPPPPPAATPPDGGGAVPAGTRTTTTTTTTTTRRDDDAQRGDREPIRPPSVPVISDTSAPSVPGSDNPALTRGNEPARTMQETPSTHVGRFEFGSYGRVWAASDLRGGTGRGTNVVAFGPRLVDEDNYAELEFRREDEWNEDLRGRIVATLALFPPFFHFSGRPEQQWGVRNLYAQGTYKKLTLWAGSRMYRGDDIYLLNWWPLDNQNTIGGGIGGSVYRSEGAGTKYETIAQFHAGMQRLDNLYQFQQIPVVAPYGFGTVDVTKLDRPRTIQTFKLTQFVRPGGGTSGFKAILYGELHQIAGGTFRDPLIDQDRGLPQDSGWMLGSQLTYFTGKRDTFGSLVMRHARGLAAYDPLAVPITFALDRTTSGASETQIAASGNYETEHFGVTAAGYVRFFRDPTPGDVSTQKYDEGTVVARPSVFLGERFGVSVEGSYQQRRIAVLQPGSDNLLGASVTKLGVMPYFSPDGRGTFKRPQIRLLYVASFRDSGARGLYPVEDVFAQRSVEHYLGIGAEWWFNSSAYP